MTTENGVELVSVNETRGALFKRRRLDLGIKSIRAMYDVGQEEGFDLSREALTAVESGTAREDTYGRYDALLRRLESVNRDGDDGLDEDGLVEFEVKGDFGVTAFVRGPVDNMPDLARAAAALARELRRRE